MAQLQIDLSASRGLYRRIGGANYSAESKNNLIYDAENGQIVSGVYNPFRQPGYIAPAVDAWVNLSFDMPNSPKNIGTKMIVGVQEGSRYVLSLREIQFATTAGAAIPKFTDTSFQFLSNDTQPNNVHSMFVGELGGVNTIYAISSSEVHATSAEDVFTDGIVQNNWQSTVASNPKAYTDLNNNNDAGFVDGKNRILYVYDGYAIHGIDGSDVVPVNGVFNAEILKFPTNYRLVGGTEFRGKIYISYSLDSDDSLEEETDSHGTPMKCGVFIWNKRSITGSEYDSIAIDGASSVRHIWNDGEALYLMTVSVGGKLQIRQFDGKTFVVIYELGSQIEDPDNIFYGYLNGVVDETVIGKNAITVSEIGSIFMTNFGNVYCLTLGGGALHKINELQYSSTPEIEYINVTNSSSSMTGNNIAYSESQTRFISGDDEKIWNSTNGGTTWSSTNVSAISAGEFWSSVAYSPTLNIFVALGAFTSTRAMSSTNGTTWTARTISTANQWQSCNWVGGSIAKFIATGNTNSNQIAYSSNGTSWTTVTITGKSFGQRPLCYNENTGEVVLIATDGTIHKSTDGITWTLAGTAPTACTSIAYSPTLNLYAIKASTSTIYTTSNFSTFTTITGVSGYTIQWVPTVNMFILTSLTENSGFRYSTDGVTFKHSNSAGNFQDAAIWNPTTSRLVSIRTMGDDQPPNRISITDLIVRELDIDNERHAYDSSNVLFYGTAPGYGTDNVANGLKPTVPHLKAFYFAENNYKNNGLRVQFLYLNNIGEISSQDFDDELTSHAGGRGIFSKDIYPLEGHVLTGVRLLPKLSIAQNLTVYCNPVPNEDEGLEDSVIGYIDIYVNQKSTPVQTKVVTRKIASKGYIDIEMNQLNVNAIQIGIRWNTEHKTGKNDMLLSQAVLTYKPIYSSR